MRHMSGPEHYLEAERLEDLAVRQFEQTDPDFIGMPLWNLTIQQAQLHATLAQTAASVLPLLGMRDQSEWREAVSRNSRGE